MFSATTLARLRKQAGMTQQELADQAGVSQGYYSKLENGLVGSPDLRCLQDIADVLKVPLDALWVRSRRYHSVFLSYGGPDEAFARVIFDELARHKIPTFFFPESASPGQRLHRTMAQGIQENDRVLLICSRSSLTRSGVLNELEQVLAKESREGGAELLIPIAIDDFVYKDWAPMREDIARQVRDRVIPDFRKVKAGTREFDTLFLRILERFAYQSGVPGGSRSAYHVGRCWMTVSCHPEMRRCLARTPLIFASVFWRRATKAR
jgi:transcriptional regulator with XRE-family HTH domain